MKITKLDIEKLADLSRLEISEAEKEKFAGELSEILTYVDKLNESTTEGVEITSQVTGLANVLRKDEMIDFPDCAEILANAPEIKNNQFKVKSILNK